MEFVDGLTLSRVLTTSGVLGPRDAVLIGVDLCGAVAAVHKAGLVHRDIKAQNLIREGGGRLVLMDFGAGEVRANPLLTASITGTPLYLAPEIFARLASHHRDRHLQHRRAAVSPGHGQISR